MTMKEMPLYLCVDCGGTKAAAAISDASGNIIGRGTGGPSNITYLPVATFILSVTSAIQGALKEAAHFSASSLPPDFPTILPVATQPSPFAAAWFGISGADSPAAIAKVEIPLSKLLGIPVGPELLIANDTHLLAGPMRMHPDVNYAIAVVGGTGSTSVGFKRVGGKLEELGRVGGWGWFLGDEGSGYDVGREAIRHMLTEQDKSSISGTPLIQSKLIDRILEKFGVKEVMEIFGEVYRGDPSPNAVIVSGEEKALPNLPREKRISSLPPLVFECAFEHGDPLALSVIKATAGHLAKQIAMHLGDGVPASSRTIKAAECVISFGGSLVGVESYRNVILEDLARRGHVFRRVAFVDDAAATGAAGLAATYHVQPST